MSVLYFFSLETYGDELKWQTIFWFIDIKSPGLQSESGRLKEKHYLEPW